MSTKISVGDTVKVLRASTTWRHMEGVKGEVLDILKDSKAVLVKDPTGQGMWPREGGSGWWLPTRDVEKIEPVELKVGDTVRVLKTSNWHKLGETGKVCEVDGLSIRVNDWWISPKEVELVTEKPKARSQEIAMEEIQKGDLIVCFFDNEGAEIRIKGIADHRDGDGDWLTEHGGYLTYEDSLDIKGIYLLERPEYKEPELADGTYWVTEKDVNDLFWWKVEVKDSKATWGIRGDMTDVAFADYEYLVKAIKGNVHVVHTTNPFPEPTNLEKFEQAGNVGQKYKHCGMIYKLSKKGKVKVRSAGKGTSWYNSAHTVGSFLELVEFGDAVKIS